MAEVFRTLQSMRDTLNSLMLFTPQKDKPGKKLKKELKFSKHSKWLKLSKKKSKSEKWQSKLRKRRPI